MFEALNTVFLDEIWKKFLKHFFGPKMPKNGRKVHFFKKKYKESNILRGMTILSYNFLSVERLKELKLNISASADVGVCSLVRARGTLRSAPHRH